VWVYRGKPEYVCEPPSQPELGAVRRTYVDILQAGFRSMGIDFQRRYEASTDPVPQSIVVNDVRRADVGT
jgi:hypothetical protein